MMAHNLKAWADPNITMSLYHNMKSAIRLYLHLLSAHHSSLSHSETPLVFLSRSTSARSSALTTARFSSLVVRICNHKSPLMLDKEFSGTPFELHLFDSFNCMLIRPNPSFVLCLDSEDQPRVYTDEILSAVSHLHNNGIIHRDIKPKNTLMGSDGHVALTDFGLAEEIDESSRPNFLCGTMEYMALDILEAKEVGLRQKTTGR